MSLVVLVDTTRGKVRDMDVALKASVDHVECANDVGADRGLLVVLDCRSIQRIPKRTAGERMDEPRTNPHSDAQCIRHSSERVSVSRARVPYNTATR